GGHLPYRLVEDLGVVGRRCAEPRDLAYVLQRRRADVLLRDIGGERLAQRLDASAHAPILPRRCDDPRGQFRRTPYGVGGCPALTWAPTLAWARIPTPLGLTIGSLQACRRKGAVERGVPRTYKVITYGCQMNAHDSERIVGLLEDAGYVSAPPDATADVVVFNTCAVRENADNRLYGNLGHLRPVKNANPGMQIAVGGCLAQKDRGEIVRRAPWVDVVFGTHNIGSLPVLLERARVQREAQVEIVESLETFPSTLPTRRESVYAAWVSISVGCNNTCTFCIVPALRGKEKDRRPGDILAE